MNRRKFLEFFGCSCCGLILPSCATVPITDRRQLSIIPESMLNRQAAQIYENVKKKVKLSDDKKTLNEIKEIGRRIEESISEYFYMEGIKDPTLNFQWEYILVEDKKIKNAWCMPGGKIAVYTGILEVTKNVNGLASVMGHEIAHAVAKHSVERASRSMLINIGTSAADIASGGAISRTSRAAGVDVAGLLTQLGINNPFNRKQESEADYLGLIFTSLAGYDIRESVNLWKDMKKLNKGKEPPEFLSTHPSSANRIKSLEKWINEVTLEYPPIKKKLIN
jgi:predicted Zn-dependent protease